MKCFGEDSFMQGGVNHPFCFSHLRKTKTLP